MTIPTLTRSRDRFAPVASAIAMIALLCVVAGCSKPDTAKEPVATVQTTPAQRAPISQVVSAEAVVFPLQQAVIVPKITSTIKTFLVQRGSKVRKGQLLAVLENKDLSAAAEQSRGEFQQAEAGYVSAIGATIPQQVQKAELDASAARTALDAQQKLYESRKNLFEQGALPRRDLESATVALAQAKTAYEVAQKQLDDLKRLGEKEAVKTESGKLTAAKGKYNSAAAMLSYSQITSPINGVVTDRPLFPGELATANQPLITLMDTSRLIAKAHVAQADAATLKAGNAAEIKVAGLDEPIKGRVTLVSPALDPGSTTIEVWVEAAKPDPAMRPGTTVQVSMTAKTVEDAVVVPTAALFKNPEGADYVVLAGSDGHAHVKVVQVGIRTPDAVQIASGINPGDLVISSGGYALPDKTQLKIEASAPPEKDAGAKTDKAGDPAQPASKAQD